MPGRILLVEDDEAIGEPLHHHLTTQGYDVTWARTGQEALAASAPPADLVLLDLGLPDIDGVEVCRRLRALAPGTVIVMLTARSAEIDVVVGLDAGADDYVTKPFRVTELGARIRAHLRRRDVGQEKTSVTVGEVSVDLQARRVTVAGREVTLRAKEFDLLALLIGEAGTAITRDRIMQEVWDEHWWGSTKTLDMHISALRRKLGDPAEAPRLITTLRGVGYRYERA